MVLRELLLYLLQCLGVHLIGAVKGVDGFGHAGIHGLGHYCVGRLSHRLLCRCFCCVSLCGAGSSGLRSLCRFAFLVGLGLLCCQFLGLFFGLRLASPFLRSRLSVQVFAFAARDGVHLVLLLLCDSCTFALDGCFRFLRCRCLCGLVEDVVPQFLGIDVALGLNSKFLGYIQQLLHIHSLQFFHCIHNTPYD